MDAIARSLHLAPKSSDFYAHLHIVDLYNVPLSEGECKIKWRFKGAVHLSAVERSQIIDKAKEGTVGYLLQRAGSTLRGAASSSSSRDRRGDTAEDIDTEDETKHKGSQHPGRLASLGKALLHPNRRRRRSSSPHHGSRSPDQSHLQAVFQEGSSPDYLSSSVASRTPRQSQLSTFSPTASSKNAGPLSPTGTIISPPSRTNTAHHLSRSQTGFSSSFTRPLEESFDQSQSPSSPSGPSKPFMPVTESKGTTRYKSLVSNACSFDQHVICAVAIPLEKGTAHLQPCPVRLAVKHKVRVTPLPQVSPSIACAVPEGSSISRSRKTSATSSPSASTHSLVSTSTSVKEVHEELPLGEITLDLAEFVEAGRSAKKSERWISRRYLLQNGKTNALLRIAVKMEWISGEIAFTPPPLATGQIKKEKVASKSEKTRSLYANSSNAGSSMMLHPNSSSRSVGDEGNAAGRNSLRPPSVKISPSEDSPPRRAAGQNANMDRYSPYSSRSGAQPGNRLGSSTGAPSMTMHESDRSAQALIEAIFAGRPPLPPSSGTAANDLKDRNDLTVAGAKGRMQPVQQPSSSEVAQSKKKGRIFSRKEDKEKEKHQAAGLHRFQEAVEHVMHPHLGHGHDAAHSTTGMHTPQFFDVVRDAQAHSRQTPPSSASAQYAAFNHDSDLPRSGNAGDLENSSPVKSWKTTLASEQLRTDSTLTLKKREGAERAKLANASRSNSTSSASGGLLGAIRPFGSRTTSFSKRNSSTNTGAAASPEEERSALPSTSNGSAASAGSRSAAHIGTEAAEEPFFPGKTIRASMDSYDSASSLSRLRSRSQPALPPSSSASSIVFRPSLANAASGSADVSSSSESHQNTDTSGRSSPTKAKSVKWEDNPYDAGREEVDKILKNASKKAREMLERDEREAQRERERLAMSRTSSRSSSRSRG